MNEFSFNDNELNTLRGKVVESSINTVRFQTLQDLIFHYYGVQPVPKPLKDLQLEASKYRYISNTMMFNSIPLGSRLILVKSNIDLEKSPEIEKGIVKIKKENYLVVVTEITGLSFYNIDLFANSKDWLIFIDDKSYISIPLD